MSLNRALSIPLARTPFRSPIHRLMRLLFASQPRTQASPSQAQYRRRPHGPVLSAAALVICSSMTTGAIAQGHREQQRIQSPDFGQREFNANCAACHGMDGKGRGPVAGFLTKNPPDLTTLARRSGGVLPMERLYRVIDGTDLPEGAQTGPHGSREMPIWGRDYRLRDAEYFGEMPYNPDAMVRGRILALLEYMNRMQER